MKKYHDITVGLHPNLPVWPDSHGIHISKLLTLAKDGWNVSRLDIDVHSGTHIDAPLHILPDGKSTDEIPLEKLIGRCFVADMRGKKQITAKDLDQLTIDSHTKKILFKTDNSALWKDKSHPFHKDFCALTTDAAQWIADRDFHLAGNDYHSIQLFDDKPDTHIILLQKEVVIVETLDLSEVTPDRYYNLICLPMKVKGVEGIPARVIIGEV